MSMNIRNALDSYKLINVVINHISAQFFLNVVVDFCLSLSNLNGAGIQFLFAMLLFRGPNNNSAKLVRVGIGGITLKLEIN